MTYFVIEGVNPEPWTAPGLGVIRRAGKAVPIAYKDGGVAAYQDAVRDALESQVEGDPPEDDLFVTFFLWRQLPAYEGDKRKVRRHVADATNMQKSLEDACQGLLFKNDRQVKRVVTHIVEQDYETNPLIVVKVEKFDNDPDWWKEAKRFADKATRVAPDSSRAGSGERYDQLDLF